MPDKRGCGLWLPPSGLPAISPSRREIGKARRHTTK